MDFDSLPNGLCEAFVLIKECNLKTAKNGSNFLDFVIGDKNEDLSAKMWDFRGENIYEAGMIVKVRGTLELYNGRDQFKILQIRPVTSDDNIDESKFFKVFEVSGEYLFSMIKDRVNNFENEDLKKLVATIIDERKQDLIKLPAAFKLHHAIKGGLMYHTMSIIKMAEKVCEVYEGINKDLLISGAILHDVAKTDELVYNGDNAPATYSTQGELIGHLVKGAMIIEETAKALEIDSEIVLLLEHMVISHHGEPEFGAAKRPAFLEAKLLNMLDNLDATIYEINTETAKVPVGEFTNRMWFLDNVKLYNHGLSENEHKVNF